jgi:cell division protein FtsZ
MASGKRASMREGPLAALFRKTEEDGLEPEAEGRHQEREAARRDERRPEPSAPDEQPRSEQPRRESAPATPAARERAEQAPVSRYDGVPTPEERLRSVFSADIPENILDRAPIRHAGDPAPDQDQIHQPSSPLKHDPVLRVVGVGGAGVNAVDRMIDAQVEGVEFIAVNTDMQSLEQSSAPTRIHIGSDSTRGLGARAHPEAGRRAAIEQYDEL